MGTIMAGRFALQRLPSARIILSFHSRIHSSCRRALSSSSLIDDKDYIDELPSDVARLVKEYASLDQTPSSLQLMMRSGQGELLGKTYAGKFGTKLVQERILIETARFLAQELPIRLATRITDLDQIPILRDMEAVQNVKKIYVDSFMKLLEAPPIDTPQAEEEFARDLKQLYSNHSGVLVQMARGAYQLRAAVRKGEIKGIVEKEDSELEFERMHLAHNFLNRFYTSRIGIRVLAGQYLALRSGSDPNDPDRDDYVGMIHLRASPSAIVRRAADDATLMCRRQYHDAPRVEITGRLHLTFPYIPTYLHYILLELLKNAMRATAEAHRDKLRLPPVTVVIADGQDNEDVVIKISDEGGGIRRSQITKIWSYLFTTADPAIQDAFIGDKDHDDKSPIAGLGYGLPIARSYCRYFGGELDLISMEGYGTDAFVHLKRLGDKQEPLH